MLGHFESLTVENGLVRITVMPQLGGRVVEYTSKASGHNQLDARLEALAPYRPGDDVPRGVLYKVSGHEDMITVEGKWHWPGDFQQEPYALEILRQSPEMVIFRLTAAKGIVRIERTHTLKRGATTLFTDLKVTNTSDVDVEMMLRHKVATRVGGTARLGDTITYPSQQGVVRKTFFPSGHWMDFLLAAGWIGASDPLTRETMMLTGDFEQLGNGGVWFDKQDFYNLEFFGRKQVVPAGGTASLASQWHLFTDMPAITFAADGVVGCFEGEKGEGNRFTLKTGLVALAPIGRVSIEGFFYNGPNRIDGFQQQMATHPLGLATAMVSQGTPPIQSLGSSLWPNYVSEREMFFDPTHADYWMRDWDCCLSRSIGYYYMANYSNPVYPYPATREHDEPDRMVMQDWAARNIQFGGYYRYSRAPVDVSFNYNPEGLEGVNALFAGGHVSWRGEEQLDPLVSPGADWSYRWVPNAPY